MRRTCFKIGVDHLPDSEETGLVPHAPRTGFEQWQADKIDQAIAVATTPEGHGTSLANG